MEKRLVLAIVLSFLVIFGFQAFLARNQKQAPVPAAPETAPAAVQGPGAAGTTQVQAPAVEAEPAPAVPAPAAAQVPVSAEKRETITVKTGLYEATWSNKGGVLTGWALKKHKSYEKTDFELVPEAAGKPGLPFPFSVSLEDPALGARLNGMDYVWESDLEPVTVPPDAASPRKDEVGYVLDVPSGGTGELRFTYADGASVRIEKVLRFRDGVYPIEIEIRVWKDGVLLPSSFLWGPGIGRMSEKEQKVRNATMGGTSASGAVFYANGRPQRLAERGYKPEFAAPTAPNWAAYEDQYFTALFVFPGRIGQAAFVKETAEGGAGFYLAVQASSPAAPNAKVLGYIGPKESEALVAFGHGTKAVIRYSKFLGLNLKPIAEIMLAGVKLCYRVVPNWGLAIILLTIVIKLLFFPLTYSSTKSMARMAELQPKVKALRAKYKKSKTNIDQRRQMNEEMMRLYKEEGINPAGGCLPLLIQLPVFVAVYQMLATAIEFRNSPFIPFWISDLSVRDKTLALPILMGGTQFITQKMTPTSADPTQAKMMLIMPFIMTFFFVSAQSGLVLYWLTTNVLQIGQQALINHMMARQKKDAHGKRK
jgi:YidC/Oxa1 family membrane protein insertase